MPSSRDLLSFFEIIGLIMTSILGVFCISYILEFAHLNNFALPPFIWSGGDDARYILSSLSQVQAAIFGIFFTLSFIVVQIQIQNKAASSYSMRRQMRSKTLVLIFSVFTVSITLDLILLRYVNDREEINIFWILSLSVFAILLLLLYMGNSLVNLFDQSIIEEIRSGNARFDLRGINLKRVYLPSVNLEHKCLSGVHLEGANLQNANFHDAILKRAHLEGADLRGAYLGFAKLEGAFFQGANLNRTNLRFSNLNGANLNGANIGYALLEGASLDGACLENIEYDAADDESLQGLLRAKDIEKVITDDKIRSNLVKTAVKWLDSGDFEVDDVGRREIKEIIEKLEMASLSAFLKVHARTEEKRV